MYIEASGQRPRSRAVLVSQVNAPTLAAGNCFVFWYHMYGPQIGRLSVFTQSQGRNIQRWTKTGTQGNKWQQASFTFTSTTDYQVSIVLLLMFIHINWKKMQISYKFFIEWKLV